MVKIGLVGAGNIGQRHIMAIDQLAEAELSAFADPSDAAQRQAASRALPCYDSAAQMLAHVVPKSALAKGADFVQESRHDSRDSPAHADVST